MRRKTRGSFVDVKQRWTKLTGTARAVDRSGRSFWEHSGLLLGKGSAMSPFRRWRRAEYGPIDCQPVSKIINPVGVGNLPLFHPVKNVYPKRSSLGGRQLLYSDHLLFNGKLDGRTSAAVNADVSCDHICWGRLDRGRGTFPLRNRGLAPGISTADGLPVPGLGHRHCLRNVHF